MFRDADVRMWIHSYVGCANLEAKGTHQKRRLAGSLKKRQSAHRFRDRLSDRLVVNDAARDHKNKVVHSEVRYETANDVAAITHFGHY